MPTRRETGRDESFPASARLRRRADFDRCYKTGRRRHGAFSVLYTTPNELDHPRLGITVSKKVGGAVVRVRTKRRIREIFRRWHERSRLPPCDLVVHVKPSAATASFVDLRTELLSQLGRLTRTHGPGS